MIINNNQTEPIKTDYLLRDGGCLHTLPGSCAHAASIVNIYAFVHIHTHTCCWASNPK